MEELTIGRLARQGGVNLETIRYYERQGLLPKPPRTSAGYRMFPRDYSNHGACADGLHEELRYGNVRPFFELPKFGLRGRSVVV